MARFAAVVCFSILITSSLLAQKRSATRLTQKASATSDPTALALAAKSIAALTGGITISDVTLTANVTWSGDPNSETGSAVFLAKGSDKSRVDLTLSGGTRTDIRNSSSGFPLGEWVNNGGSPIRYSSFNCWGDPSWFFPALTSLSISDPTIVFSYVGLESQAGISVQHLRSYRAVTAIPVAQQLSVMDFYLDASSFLPVSVVFTAHPDNNSNVNVPIVVQFSDYQPTSGLELPLHVQEYLQGGLLLDSVVTGVTVNSGLPDSDFTIQ
jgi:hypothetical protein